MLEHPPSAASAADRPQRGLKPMAPRRATAVAAATLISFSGVAALAAAWPAPASKVRSDASPSAGAAVHASGISRVEAERAEMRGQLCSSANAVGVGLRGEYFARAGFEGGPLLTRTDATLDLDLLADWPADRGDRPRSARWSGWVKAPMSGRYRFHAEPDGVVIEVATQRWGTGADASDAAVELAGGRFYPIRVEWSRVDPAAGVLRLQWTAPHGARFTIPRNSLFLPTESVASGRS